MKPDVSWTVAVLAGLAFAVFYGLIFNACYRWSIFRQDLEDDMGEPGSMIARSEDLPSTAPRARIMRAA
ncbi:hypothetical protein [Actinomadura violacea]|uniref:Uncharacterized protein n=1 Tax=Actinomadura violacea TaxID=2819934 RepID=A0ABS3S0Y2_9ACTN|nr:hypothetical protein [Actinomadura violacea]MBO2462664.1 hypothetical protein [Actinomadura violacea]